MVRDCRSPTIVQRLESDDSTEFDPATDPETPSLTDLVDVDIPASGDEGIPDGSVLGFDADTGTWVPSQPVAIYAPAVAVYRTSDFTCNNNTETDVVWEASRYDIVPDGETASWTGAGADAEWIQVRVAGIYDIWAAIEWEPFPSNDDTLDNMRTFHVVLNNSTETDPRVILDIHGSPQFGTSEGTVRLSGSRHYECAVGERLKVVVLHRIPGGGALDVLASPNYSPEFGMTLLSRTDP